jgi:hypothetical protein
VKLDYEAMFGDVLSGRKRIHRQTRMLSTSSGRTEPPSRMAA